MAADLTPALDWFTSRGWTAFPFQREVWQAYLDGESGLIHATTGAGKTYAAWMGPLLEWLDEGGPRYPSTRVLWVTPLRALVADTEAALRAPLDDLHIPWTLESRSGDTTSRTRTAQRKRLPGALVTTPESLSLFLTREDARDMFRDLRLIVVDEWHELMASKRGVQTELCLARLRRWNPRVRTWGLSATLGNLETAMETLLGIGKTGHLVQGHVPKHVIMDSLIPESMEHFPWAGHLGVHLLPQVLAAIEEGQTCLVFCNTRSQVEIWYQSIIEARPDWAGQIAVHHGSLERRIRDFVEDGLRAGTLRCVVCTSSLDLGVDFTPVDRVLQIGSPKGVARLLQRAGRSGHRPGVPSRVTCVPTHAWELVEVAAARTAAEQGKIEDRYPMERPLDLLAQHVVTIALGGGFREDELLAEVRTTHAYRDLPQDEWDWVIDFVSRGGEALRAYPEFQRIAKKDGVYIVPDTKIARRHKLSIGTITSDSSLDVRYLRGGRLGSVEEGFIARMAPGDHFQFAGKTLELVHVKEMTAYVRKAPKNAKDVQVPRWEGGRIPLSTELAAAVRDKLEEARRGLWLSPEMQAVRPMMELFGKWSHIPARDEILIERVETRDGYHIFIYPFDGRLVHEGLGALFSYRISRLKPISFSAASNDYGIELLSPDPAPLEEALAEGLFSPTNLAHDIPASLNASELARRQFREIARVAGLVFIGYPGANKSVKQFQASSGLLFDVFLNYDPGNLLVQQAHREVLERQLERSRLGRTLERMQNSRVVIKDLDKPSPLCFPLLVDFNRTHISSEKLADRVRRLTPTL